MTEHIDYTELRFAAARGATVEIGFEPIGTTFTLTDGEAIYFRCPTALISCIEVVVWPNGTGIWMPYPGDYAVLDSNRNELDQL